VENVKKLNTDIKEERLYREGLKRELEIITSSNKIK